MAIVKGRPDEIIHAGIDHHKGFALAALHINYLRDEDAGVAHDEPAWLEDQLAAECVDVAPHDLGVAVGMIGLRIFARGDREFQAAAEIDVIDLVAVTAQTWTKSAASSNADRKAQIGDLRTDMNIDAGDLDARKPRRLRVDIAARVRGMPNLFSDFPVAIFAWVCASISGLMRMASWRSQPRECAMSETAEFLLGLDVETEDFLIERRGDFARDLADAGERDAFTGHADGASAAQFAFRDDVHPGAEARQRREHRLVGIRLDRIADQGVIPANASENTR